MTEKVNKKKFLYRNAKGTKGILMSPYNGGPAIFRIYEKGGDFKDYEILHDDISIKILDDSAELLESLDGKNCYVDYSRRILGQETKYDRISKKIKTKTSKVKKPFAKA